MGTIHAGRSKVERWAERLALKLSPVCIEEAASCAVYRQSGALEERLSRDNSWRRYKGGMTIHVAVRRWRGRARKLSEGRTVAFVVGMTLGLQA